MTFDENTVQQVAEIIYDTADLTQADSEDLAWTILDFLVTGEK